MYLLVIPLRNLFEITGVLRPNVCVYPCINYTRINKIKRKKKDFGSKNKKKVQKKMRRPVIETGANEWKSLMLPLHHRRAC